jgi:adenosine deaminase CECR1
MESDDVADIYRARLQGADALTTGVEVRLQVAILRFMPNAEDQLRFLYDFVFRHRDLFVAVNMVGREDADKGHPRRFLPTLRELRQQYHSVRLSIHGGEVDEPNYHVRDTLLLGADRIGHGVNLITDDDTMRLMRHGPYLVEINLVSNLLLEYVGDYSEHPFPEYLRTGIPVALSTDDRGMWDSNLTDEFFVAVREFNLNWDELVRLSRNSLRYSFAPESVKAALLSDFDERLAAFGSVIAANPEAALADDAVSYGFICRRYQLCDW